MKNLLLICITLLLTLSLSHCSSAPKPAHCKDNGKGLQPVNTKPVTVKPIEVRHGRTQTAVS